MTGRLVLRVDGRSVEVTANPLEPLRAVLDEQADARGLAEACGVGACGACTILLDGRSVLSCLVPVAAAEDRAITTIGGLADDDPVVGAFIAATAFQCAACTPGFVLATHDLLRLGTDPRDDAAIEAGLVGNLCRCGSYGPIQDAVRTALAASALQRHGRRDDDG